MLEYKNENTHKTNSLTGLCPPESLLVFLWHWSTWLESRCRVFGPYAPHVHWPHVSNTTQTVPVSVTAGAAWAYYSFTSYSTNRARWQGHYRETLGNPLVWCYHMWINHLLIHARNPSRKQLHLLTCQAFWVLLRNVERGNCHANSSSPRASNRHRRNSKLAHLRDQSHPFIIS